MAKKIISIILAATIFLSIVPATVFAGEEITFGFLLQTTVDNCLRENPTAKEDIEGLAEDAEKFIAKVKEENSNPLIAQAVESMLSEMFLAAEKSPALIPDFSEMLEKISLASYNPLILCAGYNGLGKAFRTMGDYPEGISYFEIAFDAYITFLNKLNEDCPNPIIASTYATAAAELFPAVEAKPSEAAKLCSAIEAIGNFGGCNPVIGANIIDMWGEAFQAFARNPEFEDQMPDLLNLIYYANEQTASNPVIGATIIREYIRQVIREIEANPENAESILKVFAAFMDYNADEQEEEPELTEEDMEERIIAITDNTGTGLYFAPYFAAVADNPELTDDVISALFNRHYDYAFTLGLSVLLNDPDNWDAYKEAYGAVVEAAKATEARSWCLDNIGVWAMLYGTMQPSYFNVFTGICQTVFDVIAKDAEFRGESIYDYEYVTAAMILLEEAAADPENFDLAKAKDSYSAIFDKLTKQTYEITGNDAISTAAKELLKNPEYDYCSVVDWCIKNRALYAAAPALASISATPLVISGDSLDDSCKYAICCALFIKLYPDMSATIVDIAKTVLSLCDKCGVDFATADYTFENIIDIIYPYFRRMMENPEKSEVIASVMENETEAYFRTLAYIMDTYSPYPQEMMMKNPLLLRILDYYAEIEGEVFDADETERNLLLTYAEKKFRDSADIVFSNENEIMAPLVDSQNNVSGLVSYGYSLSGKLLSGLFAADSAYLTQERRLSLKELGECADEEDAMTRKLLMNDMITEELREVYRVEIFSALYENEDVSSVLGLIGTLLINYDEKTIEEVRYGNPAETIETKLAASAEKYHKIAKALAKTPSAAEAVEEYVAGLLNTYMSNSGNCDQTAFGEAKEFYGFTENEALKLVFCERFLSDHTNYKPYAGFMNEADNILALIKEKAPWTMLGKAMEGKTVEDNEYFIVDDTTVPGTRIIKLLKDISADEDYSPLAVPAEKKVILNLGGKILDRGLAAAESPVADGYVIENSGELTVRDDSVEGTGKITGGNATFAGAVISYGDTTLESGTITGCKSTGNAGAVLVVGNENGKFTMTGGKISNNSAENGGAIVLSEKGAVAVISGGVIEKNTAKYGGAICNSGDLTITGTVEIKNNIARNGGAVNNSSGVTVITGGKIAGNKANRVETDPGVYDGGCGGAIYSSGSGSKQAAITMTAGEISGNTSSKYGGGIGNSGYSSLIFGGTAVIQNNTTKIGSDSAFTDNVSIRSKSGTNLISVSEDTAFSGKAKIGVSAESGLGTVIGIVNSDVSGYFKADVDGEKVVWEENVLKLVEAPDECEYTRCVVLTENGTYGLKLGGIDKGEFTFTKYGCGWDISVSSWKEETYELPDGNILAGTKKGKYLALNDGKLVYSTEPFAWTYKNGAFSAEEKITTTKTTTNILTWLFSFGRKSVKTTTTVTEIKTFYLSTTTEDAKLSTCFVDADLYEEVSGEHEFGPWIGCNDSHYRVCIHCGEVETESHKYCDDTHFCVCGKYDPDCQYLDVSATYETKQKTQSYGFFGWLFGCGKKTTTVYTANVNVDAHGLAVLKTEVAATEKGKWSKGTTFTSNTEIEKFYVRITTSDGKTRLYMVAQGVAYPAN